MSVVVLRVAVMPLLFWYKTVALLLNVSLCAV